MDALFISSSSLSLSSPPKQRVLCNKVFRSCKPNPEHRSHRSKEANIATISVQHMIISKVESSLSSR
ncbi:hypothetical protein SORBI_3001G381250 [Sorghum bicolor]|uniref:Uncharacterized protein n=1 Tax=Sorghum bicolor TaxID=4558 RepID=A0A1Z5S9P5_SORBI|nr:hypothetical protein SORBI_3001G381250 [Sorghum bicolor]